MKEAITRLEYCHYLLQQQLNYTRAYFADYCKKHSRDLINCYLRGDNIPSCPAWENVQTNVVPTARGYIVFDDTVADKHYAHWIELIRCQWRGNKKAAIKGIGVITCIYVNPEIDQFWVIDYRLYDLNTDGKSKLDHIQDIYTYLIHQKALPFQAVLMDMSYAMKDLMLFSGCLDKRIYYPPAHEREEEVSEIAYLNGQNSQHILS
jgi:hypothetical protein